MSSRLEIVDTGCRTPEPARSPWDVLRRRVWIWVERGRGRRRLLELDERMLRDIGLDRETALAEARKPFWMP